MGALFMCEASLSLPCLFSNTRSGRRPLLDPSLPQE
jgi:hypothetical protein